MSKLKKWFDRHARKSIFDPTDDRLELIVVHMIPKKVISETGLPNIRFHELRHTVATLLLAKEINPKIVQEQLGHSSINLTLNPYSHVIKSMRSIAANALEDVVGSDQVCQKYAKHLSICRTDWTRCNLEPKTSPKYRKKRIEKTYKYRLDSK